MKQRLAASLHLCDFHRFDVRYTTRCRFAHIFHDLMNLLRSFSFFEAPIDETCQMCREEGTSMPTVEVNDIQMYYEIHGEGRPLVLIGGLGLDLSELQSISSWLAQRYQV